MPRIARTVLAGLLLCSAVMPALGDARNCTGIRNDEARRACQAKMRRSYSGALEKELTGIGLSATVVPEEIGDPGVGGYPRLIVWAPLTRAKVYQLIDDAGILESARTAGFRMLMFVEKGLKDYWYFDLTKPGHVALDVVPAYTPPWLRRP